MDHKTLAHTSCESPLRFKVGGYAQLLQHPPDTNRLHKKDAAPSSKILERIYDPT
jgi:hypothetical protein